ncbi:hypothetical protein EDD18DRAFT_1215707 [Armillaria luteobubalina]|uniref:Actin-like ATPase domain-containing protein n=1 Tax=Armillaria luteobubalina TaxID=153913 RepID=A0AA39P2U4_9AGAR|nr:hypothetical protein EDD18DRAFT_1215707 [Armillaria luteobubalina]
MSWQPYQGPRQKLVIALDLGTTFSGVSYSILDPGIVPEIKGRGAEALDESVIRSAEDEGWSSGDFYAYLVDCTLTFIQESHQNGTDLLSSVQDRIEFILSHPNGWEGVQQKKLRRAAKIHFVTEGEASLHFCIDHGLSSYIRDGEGVLIVDAGGGTVDISTYSRTLPRVAPMVRISLVSTFVTRRAELFLKSRETKGSQYEGEVELIADCFDKTTKHRFRNANEPAYIKFGTMRDTDPRLDIRSGQLKLSGSIFLVGGFAANTWLFLKMRQQVEPSGLSFSRPDSHVNKAVADGAVSFYIYNIVSARVSSIIMARECTPALNPSDPEHARRKSQIYILPNGEEALAGQYNIILPKAPSAANSIRVGILCYHGQRPDPLWMDREPDNYPVLFTITANTSIAAKVLEALPRKGGGIYYCFNYDIVIFVGRTELKAQICWKENVGTFCSRSLFLISTLTRGPAQIVYDRDL